MSHVVHRGGSKLPKRAHSPQLQLRCLWPPQMWHLLVPRSILTVIHQLNYESVHGQVICWTPPHVLFHLCLLPPAWLREPITNDPVSMAYTLDKISSWLSPNTEISHRCSALLPHCHVPSCSHPSNIGLDSINQLGEVGLQYKNLTSEHPRPQKPHLEHFLLTPNLNPKTSLGLTNG